MDSVTDFLRCFGEEVLIRKLIQTFVQRLEERVKNVSLPNSVRRSDLESGASAWSESVLENYEDVLLEDWCPRLYYRIQGIIQQEGRPMQMALYVALKSRLKALRGRVNKALDNLCREWDIADILTNSEIPEQATMIYAELAGWNNG